MDNYNNNRSMRYGIAGSATGAHIDQGLRSYMLRVYNYMALAMVMTALAAWLTFKMTVVPIDSPVAVAAINGTYGFTSLGHSLFATSLRWVVSLAPLGVVFFFSARINHMSVNTAQLVFWVFAVLIGISLSSILFQYDHNSIIRVFFITSTSFAGLSLYGYTTKRNLSGMRTFLIMGVIGIIIASLANVFFFESSALSFAISVIGVLVFAGLTAYDTQNIKNMYYENDDEVTMGRKAISGALSLYMNFLNMFLFLLQLFGNRE